MRKQRDLAPPGQRLWKRKLLLGVGAVVSTALGMYGGWMRYHVETVRYEIESSPTSPFYSDFYQFKTFGEIFEGSFIGFDMLFVCMLLLVIPNCLSFRQGSRSILLMKRLPKRFELAIRCLTIPLAYAFLCFVLKLLLIGICYAVYVYLTPANILPDGQLASIWRYLL